KHKRYFPRGLKTRGIAHRGFRLAIKFFKLGNRVTGNMKQSEFAREHGVSRKTVTTWKTKGLVVLNDDGTVDVEKSNELLKQNRSGKYQEDSPLEKKKIPTKKVLPLLMW
ncbi:MAG: hypothetical protein RSA22_14260, partial [Acinetobacter sp.]